ncbi:MAG: hypothetical protein EMLJLAPB_00271 [Candidatus Argoarchaeum ethanivorans]|uniref:Uncharacterized protein n=1 Tax=Candidatus Argoarchaeum ethanivorans TaxID=2608793 RepID=A0A811TAD6_9EURY|nr:MAG: hypothetical protein FFODKBPE_00048 [Candidatus Argoarchaeum ethanivorans]CAD6492419.1 MAG: hypothetical protein EMLJLAPB_00271 [Candidatus Argoarchaeum ethanivorans]
MLNALHNFVVQKITGSFQFSIALAIEKGNTYECLQ